jgi:alcohol dehydrogenase (cytochrome c)
MSGAQSRASVVRSPDSGPNTDLLPTTPAEPSLLKLPGKGPVPSALRRGVLLALVPVVLLVTCWLYPAVGAVGAVSLRKLIGFLPDVRWNEVAGLARFSSRPDLWHLAKSGNPYSSIHSPFAGISDRVHGREIFESNCSKCHGPEARGGLGPTLVGRSLSHGDSDWAVYQTILNGVPGTAMPGGVVSRQEAWRVISYLRELQGFAARARTTDAGHVTLPAAPDVSAAALLTSADEVGKWLLPGGSYSGQRFSRDTQISVANVSKLAVHWIHQFPSTAAPSESAPIVVGDYLYTTMPPGSVYALDAKSGAQVWQYARTIPANVRVCCVATNRGVAAFGPRVFVGTLDAHLVALDATTGQVLWDQVVAPYADGYSITAPPLPVGDLIITGIAGGEYPTRGFISAYDAATGVLRWRFHTIPEPGEPGHETWGGDSWKTGGASTWGSGVYDPELGLLYWGVGTPAPDFNAAARPGDNLYSSSVVALNVATGKLAWYFQFLPGDDHDWDSTQTPTLIDIKSGGAVEKLLVVANRGGFYYVLDRRTGRFIRGAPFVKLTWAVKLSPSGKPIRTPNSSPSVRGTYVLPSANGAANWWPTTYSPLTGLHYVNVEEGGGVYFTSGSGSLRSGDMFVGGGATYGTSSFRDLVKAIDPTTATVRWERRNSTVTVAPRGGLLSTAGGVLFGSDGSVLYALDALSGEQLWSFDAGGHIAGPPVTYQMGGKQLVAVMAGQDLITFALPGP